MRRLLSIAAVLCVVLPVPPAAGQMYRCDDGTRITLFDRPCPPSSVDRGTTAGRSGVPATAPSAPKVAPSADPAKAWNPRDHGGETYEAHQASKREAEQLQCATDRYNAWIAAQKPRPPAQDRRAQMDKVLADCKALYPSLPRRTTTPPPPATPHDAFRDAIRSRDINAVREQLDRKQDPNAVFVFPDRVRGELRSPAIVFAVNNSTNQIVELLVERGAKIDARNESGITALHAAANSGDPALIEFLLSRGADIAARTNTDQTPLHFATHTLRSANLKLLIARKAPLDAQDKHVGTPLLSAIVGNANNNRVPMIRDLLAAGANPNLAGPHGDYPLHRAVLGRNKQPMMEVIAALLESGARPDVRNSKGETPVALAERLGYADAVRSALETPKRPGTR